MAEAEWIEALDRAMPRGWNPEQQARSPLARWAQPDELEDGAWRWAEGDASLLLGVHGGQGVARPDDDRHVITIAGTRAGKGRSLILPNLALWPGSVIAIDPKGELARKTARWRREGLGQNVLVLDPFGVSGHASAAYNPLADVVPDSDTFMDDVALIADALIVDDGVKEKHWTDSAKNLIRAIILYMFAEGSAATLPRLRRILLGSEGRLAKPDSNKDVPGTYLFMRMRQSKDEYVRLFGQTFLDKQERELDSIISTAREQLAFLDSRPMDRVLAPSSFRLGSVKKTPTTIYLCLPAARLGTHFRWLRIFVNLAIAALEEEQENQKPVLLLLEEFAVLGHMGAVENAAGQIAGFGVKLWAILQDLGQLKALYKDRWETFFGNAGITTWFGLNDETSLEYLSKRLGDTHFVRADKVDLTMGQRSQGAGEFRQTHVKDKLLSPEEIGRLFARETRRVLVLHPGSRPRILQRLDASDPMFEEKIDGERR